MNSGLLTFPKSDQLLRGGDLLKLNKHINGFPLPASHPKIVNGLHAFPKQDVDYGVYFDIGKQARVNPAGWPFELLDYDFTIELCAELFKTNGYYGYIGNCYNNLAYSTTYADGWAFCHPNSISPIFFRMCDIGNGLSYSFNLTQQNGYHTHSIIRRYNSLSYFFDGDLLQQLIINPLLRVDRGNYAGFNHANVNIGLKHNLRFLRISKIARDHAFIKINYNNRYYLDANVAGLYNCYHESGLGSTILNLADSSKPATFGSGSASPIWINL